MMNRYRELKKGSMESLEKDYMQRLYGTGVPSLFKAGDEVFEGCIRGVNNFGELMVEHKGEIRTFGHGAITMELKAGGA